MEKKGFHAWPGKLCQKLNTTTEVKGIPDLTRSAFILSIMIWRNSVLYIIKIGKAVH